MAKAHSHDHLGQASKQQEKCEVESPHGQVHSIQHYVIKFVCELPQVGGFFWVIRFIPPIKLTDTSQFFVVGGVR
jgi:hypothetical protein